MTMHLLNKTWIASQWHCSKGIEPYYFSVFSIFFETKNVPFKEINCYCSATYSYFLAKVIPLLMKTLKWHKYWNPANLYYRSTKKTLELRTHRACSIHYDSIHFQKLSMSLSVNYNQTKFNSWAKTSRFFRQ